MYIREVHIYDFLCGIGNVKKRKKMLPTYGPYS